MENITCPSCSKEMECLRDISKEPDSSHPVMYDKVYTCSKCKIIRKQDEGSEPIEEYDIEYFIETKAKMKKQKETIIKELAKLETLNWTADEKVAGTIFPYVLVEAINLLKNSEIIENPVDYCSNSDDTNKMIEESKKS
jgi:hypothetical protein